jgi:hypothetical protein
MSDPKARVDAYLVAGGLYHDIDYARVELLKLLAEHPHVRVKVGSDYRDTDGIAASDFLVTYTCDVRPTDEQQEALAAYVKGGGRWMALHGTNSALDFVENGVDAPRTAVPKMAHTLGSQFVAHPPIQNYRVEKRAPDHPLVSGIDEFETDDELYLCEYHDFEKLEVLLDCRYSGKAEGFIEADWDDADRHLVMYLRPLGEGAVLYNTLGHCRGHWDMRPAMDYFPAVERCSWEKPEYHELLRRSIRWCLREL